MYRITQQFCEIQEINLRNNSLQAVQTTLRERGVLCTHISFSREAYAKLPSDVAADVADVLSKYFNGSFVPIAKLNLRE